MDNIAVSRGPQAAQARTVTAPLFWFMTMHVHALART